jgi:hypothetical protein
MELTMTYPTYRLIHYNNRYSIHEVQCNEEGNVIGWCEIPVSMTFPREGGVEQMVFYIQSALRLPTLESSQLPKPTPMIWIG